MTAPRPSDKEIVAVPSIERIPFTVGAVRIGNVFAPLPDRVRLL